MGRDDGMGEGRGAGWVVERGGGGRAQARPIACHSPNGAEYWGRWFGLALRPPLPPNPSQPAPRPYPSIVIRSLQRNQFLRQGLICKPCASNCIEQGGPAKVPGMLLGSPFAERNQIALPGW